jgi:hypothetical protein
MSNQSCCSRGTCPPCSSPRTVSATPKSCLTKNPTLEELAAKVQQQTGQKLQAVSQNYNKLRAAFQKNAVWTNGMTLNVGFFKNNRFYTPYKADWVKKCIQSYVEPLVNLKFVWDTPLNVSHIRITFDPYGGAWSYVGRGSLVIPVEEPTMNLGWLDDGVDYDSPSAKGTGAVVVHEFGHALGMIHEHSRGKAKLPWNYQGVCNYLKSAPNNWNGDTVDYNVFKAADETQLNGSEYDPKSIMHYYFANNFFCEDQNLTRNSKLSELDKIWLAKQYPGKAAPPTVEEETEPVVIPTVTTEGTVDSDGKCTCECPIMAPSNTTDEKEKGKDNTVYIIGGVALAALLIFFIIGSREMKKSPRKSF